MKIVSITWSSELPLLLQGARELGLDLVAWSSSQFSNSQDLERCIESLKAARLILLHPSSEACWDEIIANLDPQNACVSFWTGPVSLDAVHCQPGDNYHCQQVHPLRRAGELQ